MKTNPNPLPVFSIRNRQSKIDPKPQYQRGAVWSESMKQLLIDSILRGYDIPKFYFRVIQHPKYEYEVVDGQQRLRALWEFCENKFALGEISNDIPGMPNLEGKYFEQLASEQQDLILGFSLSITEIRDATESEIRDLFLRLQEGKSLNPPEKRNAMTSKMRDFVFELAKHEVFLKTSITNKRFEYDDWAAHVISLELHDGPVDVKAADLKKMYEKEKNFDVNCGKAKKVKKVLNFMAKVLEDSPPEMDIKWGFVDLYLLISRLMDVYSISERHIDFHDFYVGFEQQRRVVNDPADLLSNPSPTERDLYDYIIAFQREGATRARIATRHEVYKRAFLNTFPDIVPKDPKRAYDNDERIIIWRRAGMKCEKCMKNLEFTEMQADHITPHTLGGKTTIANGCCLCSKCNQTKGKKN